MSCFKSGVDGSARLSDAQLAGMFLEAPEYLNPKLEVASKEVEDPFVGITERGIFPDGSGDVGSKYMYHHNIGDQTSDFSKWERVTTSLQSMNPNTPCGPNDPCATSCEQTIGWGLSRQEWGIYKRCLTTPEFCVESLRTRYEVKQFLDMYVDTLKFEAERQMSQFIRAGYNVYSTKLVLTSNGFETNLGDPTKFPTIVDANEVGTLNYSALTELHSRIAARAPRGVQAGSSNGEPLYYIGIHRQTLKDAFWYDNELQSPLGWAGSGSKVEYVKNNISKAWMDMFLPIHINERRANIVNGQLVEEFPYTINIPIPGGIGTMFDINPGYENADFSIADVFPNSCFKMLTRPKITTLGGGTQFGAQPTMFENWMWFSDRCKGNEFGLRGYWITKANAGLEPMAGVHHMYQVLFKRYKLADKVTFKKPKECFPATGDCAPKVVVEGNCPCPEILGSIEMHPTIAGRYFIPVTASVDATVGQPLELNLTTGSTYEVAVESIGAVDASGQKVIEVTVPDVSVLLTTDCVKGIGCPVKKICKSGIGDVSFCDLQGGVKVRTTDGVLDLPAVLPALVTITFGDGSVSTTNNVVGIDATGFGLELDVTVPVLCEKGGIVEICVPTVTTATCPGCEPEAKIIECDPLAPPVGKAKKGCKNC